MANLQRPTPAFKTKTGFLTPYALRCGYIETTSSWEHDAIILDSFFADKQIYRVSWWEGNYRKEETYRSILDARKEFLRIFLQKRIMPVYVFLMLQTVKRSATVA